MIYLIYILLVVGFMTALGILLSHLECRRHKKRLNEQLATRRRRRRRGY